MAALHTANGVNILRGQTSVRKGPTNCQYSQTTNSVNRLHMVSTHEAQVNGSTPGHCLVTPWGEQGGGGA